MNSQLFKSNKKKIKWNIQSSFDWCTISCDFNQITRQQKRKKKRKKSNRKYIEVERSKRKNQIYCRNSTRTANVSDNKLSCLIPSRFIQCVNDLTYIFFLVKFQFEFIRFRFRFNFQIQCCVFSSEFWVHKHICKNTTQYRQIYN